MKKNPDPIAHLLELVRDIVDASSSREAERLLPDLFEALEPAEKAYRNAPTAVSSAVLSDLSDRRGFDHWWYDIDADIREEIRGGLRETVKIALCEGEDT